MKGVLLPDMPLLKVYVLFPVVEGERVTGRFHVIANPSILQGMVTVWQRPAYILDS